MAYRAQTPFEERVGRPEPTVATVIDTELRSDRLRAIAALGCVAEVRVDLLKDHRLSHLKNAVPRISALMPTLLTIRPPFEGGKWLGSEMDRKDYFRWLAPDVHAVDLELKGPLAHSFAETISQENISLVLSHHNFSGVPSVEELADLMGQARYEFDADYFKFAGRLVNVHDYDRLCEFTELYGRGAETGLITVGMAVEDSDHSRGLAERSRIELPGLGSSLTYAHSGLHPVVPGQLSYLETHERLMDAYLPYEALFPDLD